MKRMLIVVAIIALVAGLAGTASFAAAWTAASLTTLAAGGRSPSVESAYTQSDNVAVCVSVGICTVCEAEE